MTWRGALATAVVVVTAWPVAAAAQATPLRAPLELRQREVSREERARRAVVRPEPRRPDLQHDVIQGIQQRALQRALRR